MKQQPKNKTIEDFKNEFAVAEGFEDWTHLVKDESFRPLKALNEVAEQYGAYKYVWGYNDANNEDLPF